MDIKKRLHWGCGTDVREGWLNSDLVSAPGVILADIRHGLPLRDSSLDYVFSSHALQMLPYLQLVPALQELRRTLRRGGVLRLGLPDADRAIEAYKRGDASYFYVPDRDALTTAGKFSVQLTWYGSSLSLLTYDYARELLYRAGFFDAQRCDFGCTASDYPELASLDNRERESFFVEAWK